MRNGFSLVELSIVLVILGLLVGGILAGQSLIRASELRAVSTEYQRWITATFAFRDKYFALPGDFTKATSFWGDNNTLCPDAAITNGSPGVCNGDADGLIEPGLGASVQGEVFGYWQHLALAGLIEGSYNGIAGSANVVEAIISGTNTNSPASRIGQATWQIRDFGVRNAQAGLFNGNYGNTFVIGGITNGMPTGSILKGEEAWNIDTKIDDGGAATGKMLAYISYNCAVQANGATLPNDATGSAMLDARYNLASSTKTCAPLFRQAF